MDARVTKRIKRGDTIKNMDKKLVVTVMLIVAAVGGGFAYLLSKDKDREQPAVVQQQDTKPQATSSGEQQASQSAGAYKEYSEAAFAATSGTKVLFFHAAWCPQCRQLESDIKKGKIPGGVTIFKVDYDSSQKLRQKYGVTLQTTLVKVDDSGNEIKKFVAYDDPSLEAVVRNLL